MRSGTVGDWDEGEGFEKLDSGLVSALEGLPKHSPRSLSFFPLTSPHLGSSSLFIDIFHFFAHAYTYIYTCIYTYPSLDPTFPIWIPICMSMYIYIYICIYTYTYMAV